MNILVGFEESQRVAIAFRKKGHKAFSCDTKKCSGGHSEYHLQMDIFKAIKLKKWDIIILHVPCTYTALCGNKHYHDSPLRRQGIDLCHRSYNMALSVCDKVVLEQPKTIMQKYIGKKSQVIHPYMFGEYEYKETWLWINGLPLLKETNNVLSEMQLFERKKFEKVFRMGGKNRSELRSKTYFGIADAFAKQWG